MVRLVEDQEMLHWDIEGRYARDPVRERLRADLPMRRRAKAEAEGVMSWKA